MPKALYPRDILAAWNLNSVPNRPRLDLEGFPPTPTQRLLDREQKITAYLRDQLLLPLDEPISPDLGAITRQLRDGTFSGIRGHYDINDVLARGAMESVLYHDILKNRFLAREKEPPYYWRYLNGADLDGTPNRYSLRYLGLLPPLGTPIQGVIIYLKGYTCGIEYDPDAVQHMLQAGFAVFMMDPLDYGLSSPWNPRTIQPRSQHLNVIHVRQFIEEVDKIIAHDSRLSGHPKYLMAFSFGALHAVGALMELGAHHGIDAAFLDGAFFESTPGGYEGVLRMDKLWRDRIWKEREGEANRYRPSEYSAWRYDPRIGVAKKEWIARYRRSEFGHEIRPLWFSYRDLYNAALRKSLVERGFDQVAPRLMMGIFAKDNLSNPLTNIAFSLAFGGSSPIVRRTDFHGNIPHDPAVIADALAFFQGRLQADDREDLLIGQSSIQTHAVSEGLISGGELPSTNWTDLFKTGSIDLGDPLVEYLTGL